MYKNPDWKLSITVRKCIFYSIETIKIPRVNLNLGSK